MILVSFNIRRQPRLRITAVYILRAAAYMMPAAGHITQLMCQSMLIKLYMR